jgi:protein-S-isoprenylcysteine O-methyltransferase Ste14
MSKEIVVVVLGALLVIQTQFGITIFWHNTLVMVTGLVLVFIGILQRTELLKRGNRTSPSLPFKESNVPETHASAAHLSGHDRKEGIRSFN